MSEIERQGDQLDHGQYVWDYPFSENSIDYQIQEIEAAGNGGWKVNDVIADDPDHHQHHETKRKGSSNGGGSEGEGGKAAGESDACEIHTQKTQRKNRKKMTDMYSALHSLLPQLSPNVPKIDIVDEAVKHIETLEERLAKLEKLKQERLHFAAAAAATSKCLADGLRQAVRADDVATHNLAMSAAAAAANPSPSSSLSAPQNPVVMETITTSNLVMTVCGVQANITVQSTPSLWTAILSVLQNHMIDIIFANSNEDPSCNLCIYMITARARIGSCASSEAAAVAAFEIFRRAAGDLTKLSTLIPLGKEPDGAAMSCQLGS